MSNMNILEFIEDHRRYAVYSTRIVTPVRTMNIVRAGKVHTLPELVDRIDELKLAYGEKLFNSDKRNIINTL